MRKNPNACRYRYSIKTSNESSGPPARETPPPHDAPMVMAAMLTKTCNDPMTLVIRLKKIVGDNMGSVMWRN